MANITAFLLFAVLSQWFVQPTSTFTTTDASNLEDFLVNGYHKMVRPSSIVQVTMELGMYHITSLDNVEQTLSLVGFLLVIWDDSRLIWTPSSYGNINLTYLRTDQIWVPPLVLANSAQDIKIFSDDSDQKSVPLMIEYKGGTVYWMPAANYLAACTVDITYYPFDKQTCTIQVSSWMYNIAVVNITGDRGKVNLQLYEENGEWDLIDTESEDGSRTLHGHAMSTVTFKLKLERKHSYYILNILLPVVFISYLGCLVFTLPVESGEKNGFSLTILLSLTVVLTIVSDKIPTTSINLCILSVYLLCTVMISVFETLVTVIIQRIHIKTEWNHKLSPRGQTITRILANIVCCRSQRDDGIREEKKTVKGKIKVVPVTGRTSAESLIKNTENFEFKDLANVLDTLFFIVFFSVTSIITLTFVIILVTGQ